MKRLPVKGRATQEETPNARSRKQCNLLKTVLMLVQNKTKDILILVRKEDRSLMLQSIGYLHGYRNALCTLCQKEKKNSKQKNHQNSSEYD
jgi:hypothetical protein